MTINLEQIKQRLEAKRAELQENIKGLTEAHPEPVGAIEANDGSPDFEKMSVAQRGTYDLWRLTRKYG